MSHGNHVRSLIPVITVDSEGIRISRCIASIEECCILVNQNVGNMYDDVQ